MALPTLQVPPHATTIGSILVSVGLAVLLFAGGFGILFWNEGRVDVSVLAEEATPLSGSKVSTDPALQGKLVAVTGEVLVDEPISDELFLESGNYLSITRKVERFHAGDWQTMSEAGEDFIVADAGVTAETFTVGEYSVAIDTIDLPRHERLVLTDENVDLSGGAKLENNFVFMGTGSVSNPDEGDLRIAYTVVHDNFTGTVLGKLKNSTLLPYEDGDGQEIFALYDGFRDDALAALSNQDTARTWVLRIIGVILYWVAMTALLLNSASMFGLLKPFSIFLTRFLLGAGAIPAAIVVAGITFLSASWFHSLLLSSLLTLAAIIALAAWWLRYVRRRQARVIIPGR